MKNNTGGDLANFRNALEKISSEDWRLGLLIRILFYGGFRVSEVLEIRAMDIDQQGGVLVKGKKGSNSRYFFDSSCAYDLLRLKACEGDPFEGIDRFRVYRRLKYYGIGRKMKGRVRESVTHLGRHLRAEKLRQIGAEGQVISSELGHKNKKNERHYGDKSE